MKKQILKIFLLLISINYCQSQSINKFTSNGVSKEIIVLPVDFKLDNSIELLGKVKSGNPTFSKKADYKTQLDKICKEADIMGGNIVVITKFDNLKLTESYNLKASAYKVADYEKLKADLFNNHSTAESSSEIILYRPNYTYSLNDLYNFTVVVDNQEYVMKRNTKKIIKITNKSTVELFIKETNEKIKLDIKPNENYYVRCVAYFPNNNGAMTGSIMIPMGGYVPKIKLIDEYGQGEVESKLINIH